MIDPRIRGIAQLGLAAIGHADASTLDHCEIIGAITDGHGFAGIQAQSSDFFIQQLQLGAAIDDRTDNAAGQPVVFNLQCVRDCMIKANIPGDPVGKQRKSARYQHAPRAMRLHRPHQRLGTRRDPHALVYAGVLSQDSPLRTALSNTRSGEIVAVADGSVKPLQTFITGEGTVCREYEAKRAQDGVTGIACWSEDTWRVETLVANAQAVNDTGSSLMPASGFDTAALEAVLEDMGALPGLDADAEQCLIANAWNSGPCQEKFERWE